MRLVAVESNRYIGNAMQSYELTFSQRNTLDIISLLFDLLHCLGTVRHLLVEPRTDSRIN